MEPMITISVNDYNELVESANQGVKDFLFIIDKLKTAHDREHSPECSSRFELTFDQAYKYIHDSFIEKKKNLSKVVEDWKKNI